jgi:hypothetical protein
MHIKNIKIHIGDHIHNGDFEHKDFMIEDGDHIFWFRTLIHSGNYGFCLIEKNIESGINHWKNWHTDGEEHGKPYMIIIPQNRRGQHILRSMQHNELSRILEYFEIIIKKCQIHRHSDLHIWILVTSICHMNVSEIAVLKNQAQ